MTRMILPPSPQRLIAPARSGGRSRCWRSSSRPAATRPILRHCVRLSSRRRLRPGLDGLLDELTGELTRVVQETLQPEGVSVWLKPEDKWAKYEQ